MPASATGGAKPAAEVRAIVETLGLDGSVLGDGDFSALSLSHSNDQYTSSELERLVNIQAELEELSTAEEQDIGGSGDGLTVEGEDVEVSDTSTTFEHGQGDTILEHSPETILPDVLEGTGTTETDVHQVRIASPPPKVLETVKRPVSSHQPIVSTSLLYSSAAGTKSSQVTGSSIVVIQSPTSSNPSGITSGAPTHLTFSGGQLLGKISGMSNLTTIGSMPQFQSLGQTLVTAKSADGNIVQLRPAGISRSITATNTTGNTNPGTIQGIRPLQATIKRPGTSLSAPMRNVYAKVIIGNHSGQVNQGQPFMISTSQSGIGEATFTNRQSVKLINTSGGTQGTAILGTPPKAITLSQAQQMGLLSSSKLQQILPSSANKQSIILNKLVTSPGKSNATKITMVPSSTVVKSPTKILPAPVGSITQLKPTSTLASGPTLSVAATSASTTFRPLNSPQKVIIRQSALKSGTVLTSSGTGQMIRIPATQNIIGTLPGGKQVQYVRLVSTANSSTANVVSHTKPRTTTVFPVNAVTGVSAPKPLAITTVRNQPQALKVVPIAPATSAIRTVVPKPTTTTQNSQRILIPTSTPATQLRAAPSLTTLSASGVSQLMPGTTILQSSTGNYVMLPAQYIQQIQNQQANQQQQQQHHVSVPPSLPPASSQSSSSSSQSPPESTVSGADSHSQSRSSVTRTTVEPNGIRPRKPCNCTKSQCLKLYCDCFANGEFCHMCNCNNCYNNLEHEEDRQRAIKSCLERNSNAFRPKIGKGVVGDERRHNKGCNCKRSGCLKNYCECYEAKISCSHNCKCIGCRNVEELCEKKTLRDLADAAEVRVQQHVAVKSKLSAHIESIASRSNTASGAKQPSNFMTQDVVDATCQCLLAQADEAERFRYSEDEAERLIIEEFGKCLVQIIECASNN